METLGMGDWEYAGGESDYEYGVCGTVVSCPDHTPQGGAWSGQEN